MRAPFRVLVAVSALAWTNDAAAAGHSARLVYVRAKDAVACTDEEGVRAAVARRLGYDPFVGFAEMTLVVDVRRGPGSGFTADLRVVHADGVAVGRRVIETKHPDCRDLVDALALTMSIVVDPVSVLRGDASAAETPAGPQPPPPEPPPPPPVSPDPSPANEGSPVADVPPPASARLRPLLAVAPFGSVAEGPGLALGGIVHLSLEASSFSLGVEARADLPSQRDIAGGGSLRSHSASGWLLPCADYRWLEGCVLVGVGAVFAESTGVAFPRSDVGVYFGAGARAAATFPLTPLVVVRPFVDGIVQPFPARYDLSGVTVYRLPTFGADVGLMLGARFL